MVYFILDKKTNNVKIGHSKDPRRRVKELNPQFNMKLLCCMSGAQPRERLLHDRFQHLRTANEWFKYEGELKEYIEYRMQRSIRGDV